ncbi:copper resistance protein D [Ornithinimicrobium pekingense]|uniref:Copper resistance protein D n=1 Tax=Ornithinimicrobium pekingense TaxID=384677 RepID=A0ABQ2FDC7_9MICO|nr:copper resistance protein D [Ornithinimicrobium pekingense]
MLALVSALAVAVWATGAAEPPPLGDPGAAVRWGLPVVTGLGRGAAALTVGALVLCVALVSPTGQAGLWGALRRVASLAAGTWFVLQAAQLVLTFRDVLGGARLSAPAQQVGAFLDLGAGRTLVAATVLTALVAVATLVARQPGETLVAQLLCAAALLQLAGTGHTGGTAAHGAAVLGLWLHTLSACVWVGGLAALVLVVARRRRLRDGAAAESPDLSVLAGRYSAVAAWAFVVLALSGVFSLAVRVDAPSEVLGTAWGRLLLVKVVLLGVLGSFGALHRRHTLPLLRRGRPGAFRRLAAVEVLVMASVLGMSSALARTRPPHSEAPVDDSVVALTGYAAPPAPSVLSAVTELRLEPVTLLLAGSSLVVYLRWVRRVRAAGVAWPRHRTLAAVVGAVGLAWVTSGGLAVYGSVLLGAHRAQLLLVLAVLPVLYVAAAPVTLGLQALPVRDDGSVGPREWLQRAAESAVVAVLTRPLVAGAHAAAALTVTLLPPVRGLLLASDVASVIALLYLTAVGVLLAVALGRPGAQSEEPLGARLLAVLPLVASCVVLGLQLRTSTVLVEPGYYSRLALPWVDNPLVAQRTAGLVMLALGGVSALVLAWLAVRSRRATVDREPGVPVASP